MMDTANYGNVQVVYKKIKTLRLRILSDGVAVVSVPLTCPTSTVNKFINQHEKWIAKKRQQLQQRPTEALLMRNEFIEICHESLEYWSQQMQLKYTAVRFRKMKTRWGTCNTTTKTITLNTELMKYPSECTEYVIIHELAHLQHRNHSSAFWNVVAKYCINYKQWRSVLA